MARLPLHPNTLSMSQIRDEFGGSGTLSLSNYYRGGSFVPGSTRGYPLGVETLIPASGNISIGNFHGARRAYSEVIYGTTYWTVPSGVNRISVVLVAGGGGSGAARGSEGGGGGGAGGVLYLRNLAVTPGSSILVSIGGGGGGSYTGGNSSFGSYVAYGGGPGGYGYSTYYGLVGYRLPENCGGGVVSPDDIYEIAGGYCGMNATPIYGTVTDYTKTGGSGGSGGGGMGYYGGSPGGSGVSGQGYHGGYGYEEGPSGGGGGAGGPGGSTGAGPGRTFYWPDRTFTVGTGGIGGTWGYTGPSPGAYGTGNGARGPGSKTGVGSNGGSGVCYILVGGED